MEVAAMVILVTGGARSGKSKFAEQYIQHLGKDAIYIATAQIYDEEMKQRMELHQSRRKNSGYAWKTKVEPYDLASVLRDLNAEETAAPLVLVDCLTLWLSNWLLLWLGDGDVASEKQRLQHLAEELIEQLNAALQNYSGKVILVTNEVGAGIVPENALGRLYRDWAGMMNQRIADLCEQVFLVTSGIPLELKRNAYRFE
jgi:adenosylcobinamide kinase/adenosylcobinamide-phosphate guanylyltransferase